MSPTHPIDAAARRVRWARKELDEEKTFENAIRVQRAELAHKALVRETIKLVEDIDDAA